MGAEQDEITRMQTMIDVNSSLTSAMPPVVWKMSDMAVGGMPDSTNAIFNSIMSGNLLLSSDLTKTYIDKLQYNFQTVLGPANPAFVDATLNSDDLENGLHLDYNKYGVLMKVDAAGNPTYEEASRTGEQERVIAGATKTFAEDQSSNISSKKSIGEGSWTDSEHARQIIQAKGSWNSSYQDPYSPPNITLENTFNNSSTQVQVNYPEQSTGIIYIFYEPKDFTKQAEHLATGFILSDYDVRLIPVTTKDKFAEDWGNMHENVDSVYILTHGDWNTIVLRQKNAEAGVTGEFIATDRTDEKWRTHGEPPEYKGEDAIPIKDLAPKKIDTLVLQMCDAGSIAYSQAPDNSEANVAVNILRDHPGIRSVVAWDGELSYTFNVPGKSWSYRSNEQAGAQLYYRDTSGGIIIEQLPPTGADSLIDLAVKLGI